MKKFTYAKPPENPGQGPPLITDDEISELVQLTGELDNQIEAICMRMLKLEEGTLHESQRETLLKDAGTTYMTTLHNAASLGKMQDVLDVMEGFIASLETLNHQPQHLSSTASDMVQAVHKAIEAAAKDNTMDADSSTADGKLSHALTAHNAWNDASRGIVAKLDVLAYQYRSDDDSDASVVMSEPDTKDMEPKETSWTEQRPPTPSPPVPRYREPAQAHNIHYDDQDEDYAMSQAGSRIACCYTACVFMGPV